MDYIVKHEGGCVWGEDMNERHVCQLYLLDAAKPEYQAIVDIYIVTDYQWSAWYSTWKSRQTGVAYNLDYAWNFFCFEEAEYAYCNQVGHSW